MSSNHKILDYYDIFKLNCKYVDSPKIFNKLNCNIEYNDIRIELSSNGIYPIFNDCKTFGTSKGHGYTGNFEQWSKWNIPYESFEVLLLDNPFLFRGVVLNKENMLIKQSVPESHIRTICPEKIEISQHVSNALEIIGTRLPTVFEGTYIYAVNFYHNNYFHFLIQEVISAFFLFFMLNDRSIKILAPINNLHIYKTVCHVLNLDLGIIQPFDEKNPIKPKKSLLPSSSFSCLKGGSFQQQANLYSFFQKFKLPSSNYDNSKDFHNNFPNKIYLSRRGVSKRALSNELEVERMFKKFGFEIIFPEKLDFFTQMHLFRNASVVAGCTGAALSNMIFMKPQAKLLTLYDVNCYSNGWHIIAKFLNLNLYVFISESNDGIVTKYPGANINSDNFLWAINLKDLENALNSIIIPAKTKFIKKLLQRYICDN